jgi:3-keto steroid reductase
MAFAVLAPQLLEQESREGKGKWGSATGVQGDERVARTEVPGWGYCGRPGVVPSGSVTTGHYRGRRATTREGREEFEECGRLVWKQMEEMRVEWERRLGPLVWQDESLDV